MSDLTIASALPAGAAIAKPATADKMLDAAQQFETLLMGQILRSARQDGKGWLGEEDSAAECATDYAEQQFAAVLGQQGGLGLASLIVQGL
jgi:Rod binding domain-containing protein